MSDKPKGRWAEGASAYKPSSASAKGGAKATRPWHIESDESGSSSARGAVAFARTLPIASIDPDVNQPRRTFAAAALAELAASIGEQGVLQPLLVRRAPGAKQRYLLVAGERRLRAAKMAGLEEVPCMVLAGDSLRDARLAQLAENLQREDLEPMEEARAVVGLAEVEQLSHEELARRLGKSPAYISRIYSISRIESREYEELSTSKPSASLLYEYAQIGEASLRAKARALVRDGATVREIEALRGRGKGAKAKGPKRGRPVKGAAPLEALRRAVRALGALDPETARTLDRARRAEILGAIAELGRWAAETYGAEPELGAAVTSLETALARASSARASTREGRAGRAGRKATRSRPR